jgi:hypothetical protein
VDPQPISNIESMPTAIRSPDDDWHGNATSGIPLDVYHPEFSYVLEMKYAPPAIQSVVWSEPTWNGTAAGGTLAAPEP